MCIQCAVIAVSVVGAAGVLRNQVSARLDLMTPEERPQRPSPLLFLLILAALAEQQHAVDGDAPS